MQKEDLLKYLSDKTKKPQKSDIEQIIEKYPFFETAYRLYVNSLEIKDFISFENTVKTFSHFINDRRKLFFDNFPNVEIEKQQKPERTKEKVRKEQKQKKTEVKDKSMDGYDEATYERQKNKHKNLMEDIIKPKVQKMIKLSALLKKEGISEKELLEELSEDNMPKSNIRTIEQKSQKKEEEKEDKQQPKTQKDIEEDIFEKINKLKKQKIQVETPETPIEQKQEEKKAKEEKQKEIQTTKEETQKTNPADLILQKLQSDKKDVYHSTENKNKKVTAEEILNKLGKKHPDTKDEHHNELKEDLIKVAGTEQNKQDEKNEQERIEKIVSQEQVVETNEENKEDEKNKKESTVEQQKETEQREIVTEQKEEQEKDKKEEAKTAADRILERLKNRKKQNSMELIDKFLEEQPRIDRKKEPQTDENLAENKSKDIDVATERLAEIYTLQGLYDKAIATYEKLILKFPEKKTYFANKIEEIKQKQQNK